MAEGSVITEKGRALLGKILATNSTLNITGAQIGSGDLPAGTPPASMTALASYVMDATIVAISTPAAGEVKVVLQVLSNDVETAFLAKEVALLASDPDEGDVVYCYVPMQDDPVQMRAAGDVVGKLLTMEISMIVSNVANVTAVISPEGLVRRKELEKYALVTHSHVIADIQGLQELLNSYQNSIDLLTDLISGDMPGGINFALDFAVQRLRGGRRLEQIGPVHFRMIRIACSDSEASCLIASLITEIAMPCPCEGGPLRICGTGPDGAPAEVRILGGGVYEIEGPTAETVAIIRERRGLY